MRRASRELDYGIDVSDNPAELTKPRVVVQAIRFITDDVALVDAANTQFGSTILLRRVPLIVMMRREATGWGIVSLPVMLVGARCQQD